MPPQRVQALLKILELFCGDHSFRFWSKIVDFVAVSKLIQRLEDFL